MTIHNKICSTLLAGAVFPDGMFASYKECGRKWQRGGFATVSNPQPLATMLFDHRACILVLSYARKLGVSKMIDLASYCTSWRHGQPNGRA